jgi:hypothetical protein
MRIRGLCIGVIFAALACFVFSLSCFGTVARKNSAKGNYGEVTSDSFFGPSVVTVSDANGPLATLTSFGRCSSQAASSDHCAFEDSALDLGTPNFIYFYVVHFLRTPSQKVTLTIPGKFVDATFSSTVFAGIIGDDQTSIAACNTPLSDSSASPTDPLSVFNCAAQFFDDTDSSVDATQAVLIINPGLQANDTLELHVDSFVPPACFVQLNESPIDPANCPASALMSITIGASTLGTPQVPVVAPTPLASPFSLNRQLTLSPSSVTIPQGLPLSISLTSNDVAFSIDNTSKISWNGQALTTSFATPSGVPTVSASISASLLASAGTARVSVTTGGVESNPVAFVLNAPTPVINSFSPLSLAQGEGPTTITLNGSGFVANSVVQWNTQFGDGVTPDCNFGDNLPTQFVSPTQLTATVFADDLRTFTSTVPLLTVFTEPGSNSCNGLTKIGFGIASGSLAITADSIPKLSSGAFVFGHQLVGAQSAAQTLTIANDGNAVHSLTLNGFTLTGDSADFTVTPDAACTPVQVVNPNASCNVAVTFAPVHAGLRAAVLQIANDSAHSTLSVSLSGTGDPPATTTALVSSVNPSSFGQSVTFTATVSSGTAAKPTGSVTFKDGATTLGTGSLNASAIATFTTGALAAGTHSLTAVYGGNADFGPSASTALTQTVNSAASSTAVTSSANPSTFGSSVTLTATVTSAGGTPTGMVTFKDGAGTLGTGALNASGMATFSTSALAAGAHSITAVYGGDSNFATSTSAALTQTVNAATTTTVVASSSNPSVFGQSVTFTATVTSGATGTPTGTVTFNEGTTTLGTGALNASGTAAFNTSALAGGAHSITAVYGGDANFATSTSAALTQTVSAASTTTAVTALPNPSVFRSSVTFTATVTSTAGTPAGTVTFKDGGTTLGTGTLNASAVATFSTSALAGATHSITAVYGGNANFATSTSVALTQTVNTAATTTAVASSVNPSVFGQSVTFTATVTSGAGGTPTGTVTFKDGATTLGTGTLNASSIAALSTSPGAGGAHSITAVYSGDNNFSSSTSPALTQTVNLAATSSAVTSSANPSGAGQAVTFTATVTSAAGTPTGNVTFKDGATALGTGALNASGVATFATSTLAAGGHSITAVYGGDTNFATSTSPVFAQSVRGPTTTALVSSANPSMISQSVTFTATVTSTAAGTPTGTITFKDGATTLGIGTLNVSGLATLSTTVLAGGSHAITAAYGGDANFGVSTSNTVTQVVNLDATTTTVASSTNPSQFGAAVTFTATVTSASAGTPTGTVTFKEGTTTLGTGTLSASAAATFSTSNLASGTHSVTAVYTGDATFATSTSPALTQTVNAVATSTTLASSHNPSQFGQSITFTAIVTPGGSGTVTFKDGATTLGTSPLQATIPGPSATFTTTTLTGGSHTITAVYNGDVNTLTSTSAPVTQTVNKAASATAVASSLNPSGFGNSVTFTATVTSAAGTPTSTVTFKDGAATLGTGALNASGAATFATSTLTAGTHAITAVYGGDTNFTGSTSAALTQTVKGTTSTALTSAANPSNVAQSVLFTATVTPTPVGAVTGSITFMDGTATLGTGALNASAVATFATTTLAAGSHSITAVYAGDANFTGSTSTALTQTVNAPDFSVGASPQTQTITAGQSGVVTFTVTPINGSTQTVAFSCSGLPAHSSCMFVPPSVTLNRTAAATSTATIQTALNATAPFAPNPRRPEPRIPYVPLTLLALTCLAALLANSLSPDQRLRRLAGFSVLLIGVTAGLAACSGGSTSTGSGGTPPGSYSISISAAATGGATHSASVTIVVH